MKFELIETMIYDKKQKCIIFEMIYKKVIFAQYNKKIKL